MEFLKSKTYQNIVNSYRGEISGSILYKLLEKKAQEENYKNLAIIFEQFSLEEKGHGNILKQFIKEDISKYELSPFEIDNLKNMVQSTIQNLHIFSQGEKKAGEETYVIYSKIAKEEGYDNISKIFLELAKLEIKHGLRLEEELNNI
ncbi:ferritin family protein [Cetobacterium ceti]